MNLARDALAEDALIELSRAQRQAVKPEPKATIRDGLWTTVHMIRTREGNGWDEIQVNEKLED